ncbi:MAG: pilus assembly protein [Desulfobulbaceae bacterium]
MKRYAHNTGLYGLVIGLLVVGLSGAADASDVCSRGLGQPPFLSFGVNSNLLMLLDNSGSMLDMAYVDTDTDGAGADRAYQCFDEGYVSYDAAAEDPSVYAGNYTVVDDTGEVWYTWVDANVQPWRSGKWYAQYSLVTYEGMTYRAWTAGTSSGATIADDSGVDWQPVLRPEWRDNKLYHAYSFIFDELGKVYYNKVAGTSNGTMPSDDTGVAWTQVLRFEDTTAYGPETYVLGEDLELFYTVNGGVADGTRPTDDEGIVWEPADFHAWRAGITYSQYDIVTYDSMIYWASASHLSSGQTIYDDIDNWTRIDEGHFEAADETTARGVCRDAAGVSYYSNQDVCITINNEGAGTTNYVSAFAATGNFLNWATASKFDIQKDILTGGKYNDHVQRLITENRGCAGNRFVKQIAIQQTSPAVANMFLTMAVRMPSPDDSVDWADDTTRLEIYAITATGMDFEACQDAIEAFQDPGGLGPAEADVEACVGFDASAGSGNVEHIIYHKAIQECWFYAKHGTWKGGNDHPRMTCPVLYESVSPLDISSWDPEYVCYGIFDETLPHDERTGFVGRCWEFGTSLSGASCDAYPRDAADCDWAVSSPCLFWSGGTLLRNKSDSSYTEYCTQLNNQGDDCQNNTKWKTYYIDSVTGLQCDPTDDVTYGGTPTYWSDNLDGDDLTVTPPEPDVEDVADECVNQAMHDFCLQTEMPEVIDPSDEATETTDYWNLPAILIDTGLAGQLGGHPLATLKGHIKQDARPTGILQSTAGVLRIGAMAFNNNGAGTECDAVAVPPQIVQYCPRTNKDGARVITPIRLGSLLTEDVNDNGSYDEAEDTRHLDNLVTAINAVRATSWTPLAEAMYNAIGYYTQNSQVRINDTDFQTDAEVIAGWQDNHDYAPGSYVLDGAVLYQTVLGGLSTGATLAGDTGIAWAPLATYDSGGWVNGTTYPAKTIIQHTYDYTDDDGNLIPKTKLYITYAGGTAEQKGASPGGPLYDLGMTWEPFIDPVINWCQENHVLVITEGASTADIDADVTSFVQGTYVNTIPIEDPGEDVADDPAAQCTDGLQGSTYLDDLAYFAWNHEDPTDRESTNVFTLYPTGNAKIPAGDYPYTMMDKNTIKTHFVVAGALRDNGIPSECNPVELMNSAAYNGGTTAPLLGENPKELEENLLNIFNSLAQRASAGSAASVISSARGGEGAIYQAIFWPELKPENGGSDDYTVAWAGDVHGLFLDNRGYMYEDTNGDRKLTPYEDLDGDGNFDVEEARGEDIDGDGNYDCVDEDRPQPDLPHGDGHLDVNEDLNGNGVWEPELGEDVDGDGYYDTVNEDLDGDGYLDTGEDVNHNGNLDPGENINGGDPPTLQRTEDLDGEGCSADAFDPFVDVDGDGHQDVNEDLNGNGVFDIDPDLDRRVIIYYDDGSGRSRACYRRLECSEDAVTGKETCSCDDAYVKEMHEVKFLWSANKWLSDIPPAQINSNRDVNQYISDVQERFIFTWNDLDNDGIVDDSDMLPGLGGFDDEIIRLDSSVGWGTLPYDVASRGPVINDFDVSSEAELDLIVDWLRGTDSPTQRSRQFLDADGNQITWRLGDIIHSTPMTVATPAEGYHLIYSDFSYAQFLDRYKRRRHVVYFGGNDGLLHAVNAGFYSESEKRFCLYPIDTDGHCTEPCPVALVNGECPDTAVWPTSYADAPELGTELWAYLPYNLQPHVKCLTDPEYSHKYFVDQRPRIFDAQIFTEEAQCRVTVSGVEIPAFDTAGCIHPNGWGTILVGGLRFGGTRIRAAELNGIGADTREFISSYFILDITNPDKPPVLLGELSREVGGGDVNLGYSAMIPTMVIMKDGSTAPATNKWYLMLGSGPRDVYGAAPAKAIKGISDNNAKIAVLPLEWVTGKDTGSRTGLRIPDADPVSENSGGRWELGSSPNGFVSDAITVDFDINPSYKDYKADAVYFGTIQGGFATSWTGTTYWRGGGLMYRLVTKNLVDVDGYTEVSPIGRGTTETVTNPSQWQIKPLIDLRNDTVWPYTDPNKPNQPITAAASVGTDGYNFWIYFGTGRFFDADDKTDSVQQSYYGIKEPMVGVDLDGSTSTPDVLALTWQEVERTGTSNSLPGGRGLLKVDDILVKESPSMRTATLSCRTAAGYGCLPVSLQDASYATLAYLDQYIAGTGDCTTDTRNNCVDGWYSNFYPYANREKNVGQATLLGGLVTYTTYQPFNDVCQAEGNAYLYGVYYRTGTAWHENIFGTNGVSGNNIEAKLDLGRGLAQTPNLHVGSGTGGDQGPKAFVQTSTGEIKEIQQENLPIKNYRTGRSGWREYLE